eukprot:gene3255-2237_t
MYPTCHEQQNPHHQLQQLIMQLNKYASNRHPTHRCTYNNQQRIRNHH